MGHMKPGRVIEANEIPDGYEGVVEHHVEMILAWSYDVVHIAREHLPEGEFFAPSECIDASDALYAIEVESFKEEWSKKANTSPIVTVHDSIMIMLPDWAPPWAVKAVVDDLRDRFIEANSVAWPVKKRDA